MSNPFSELESYGATRRQPSAKRPILIVCVIIALALIGFGVFNEVQRRNRVVWIVNGLSTPVKVAFDDQPPIQVMSNSHKVRVTEGIHHVKISGPVTEEFDIDIQTAYVDRWFSNPVWIINPGGAAEIAHHTMYYAEQPNAPTETQWLVGQSTMHFRHVDYAFTKPPDEIQLPSSGAVVKKTHLEHVNYPASDLYYIAAESEPPHAYRFAESRLAVQPDDSDLFYAYIASASESAAQSLRVKQFLKKGLWREPISVRWHRIYLQMDLDDESLEEMKKDYDARLTSKPNDAALLYLRGLASVDNSVEYFTRAREADPTFSWPCLALGWVAAESGEWPVARSLAEEALSLGLTDPSLKTLRHLARMATGDGEALIAEYRAVVSPNDPWNSATTVLKLCEVLAHEGKPQEAQSEFQRWTNYLPPGERDGHVQKLYLWITTYMVGDVATLAENAKVAAGEMPGNMRLHARLLVDKPDEVVSDSSLAAELANPWQMLAVAIAFELSGNKSQAGEWIAKATLALETLDDESQLAADVLRRSDVPTVEQIADLSLRPELKALLLCALASRFPDQRAQYCELAARLNVALMTPHHLVRRMTELVLANHKP
jgi:hypothetical protein